MRTLITLLSFLLLLMAPLNMDAGNTGNIPKKRTVTIKKYPRKNKDHGKDGIRIPSAVITCTVDKENGIQPLDTSDIESFEVWDSSDTAPMVVFEDEAHFIDYILDIHPEGIIKMFTPEYVYIGFLESTLTP